jgi:hypothetical protein
VRSRSGEPPSISVELTERIHAILASKGLTLYQVSQQTAKRYGRSSPFFLPHNLYYDVRRGALTPSVFQVFSLSRTSGYRLSDWLRVVGIEIENIPRLQALMQRKRTAIIDIALTDAQDSVEWFRSRLTDSLVRRLADSSVPAVAPLTQLLEPVGLARIASLARAGGKKFIYAKIGTEDALAFPELLPGSIVRINPELIPDSFPAKDGAISDRIFLLEHSNGLYCCKVRRVRENVIVPAGTKLSYAQVELRLSSEAKILGVVDFEIRSLLKGPNPEVPNRYLTFRTRGLNTTERLESQIHTAPVDVGTA